MKKIFSKKTVAITAVTIFMVSLFAWGLVAGEDPEADPVTGDTFIEVMSGFSLSLDPTDITFDRDDIDADEGSYGDIYPTVTDEEGPIYGNTISAEVMSYGVADWSVKVSATDLTHEGGLGDGISAETDLEWTVKEDEEDWAAEPDWFSGLHDDGTVVWDHDDGDNFDIALRVIDVGEDVEPGDHEGEITFDLSSL